MTYLSVADFAKKHGRQPALVRRLCMNGRIKGATSVGSTWLIPENAPYPADARVGKRV
ncbi:MAG: DNA-binding protein [Oscillospiraceae bacterium]|nr:DNA-binding protein [Oscillospiraceae bacterium]